MTLSDRSVLRAWAVSLVLATTAVAGAVAQSAPALQVTTLDGKRFDLAQHRGRWVVVNWWATWCVPCIKELPEISSFIQQHRGRVVAIGLAFEDSERADVVGFLQRRPVGFPVAQVDPAEPPSGLRAPLGLPNTVVIGPDGRIVREFLGPVTAKDLQAVLDR